MHDIDLYGLEIPELPGYRVFRNGEILGLKGELIKPFKDDTGYLRFGPYVCGFRQIAYVHRLVAAAYRGLDYSDQDMHVDHINEIKDDCRAENLEPVTQSINQLRRSAYLKDRTHKTCSDCLKEKHIDDFAKIKKTGYPQSICRKCNKIRGRKYYQAKKDGPKAV